MKKKIIMLGIILLIILIIVGIAVYQNNNKKTDSNSTVIKMNEVTRSVFYAPQYVAINNGYFKAAGGRIQDKKYAGRKHGKADR